MPFDFVTDWQRIETKKSRRESLLRHTTVTIAELTTRQILVVYG